VKNDVFVNFPGGQVDVHVGGGDSGHSFIRLTYMFKNQQEFEEINAQYLKIWNDFRCEVVNPEKFYCAIVAYDVCRLNSQNQGLYNFNIFQYNINYQLVLELQADGDAIANVTDFMKKVPSRQGCSSLTFLQ